MLFKCFLHKQYFKIYKICLLYTSDARRDWGYAKDYVECMWLILQHDVPEDFVIATGEMHTVREFATLASFQHEFFSQITFAVRFEFILKHRKYYF